MGKNSGPQTGPKFTQFCDDVAYPLYFQTPLHDYYLSRFVQKIFAIKSRSRRKTEQMQFLAPFWRREHPIFLRQIVSAIYCPPFGKVWLSSVCWSRSAKPGNEVECRIYRGWVKWRTILSCLRTNVHDVKPQTKRCATGQRKPIRWRSCRQYSKCWESSHGHRSPKSICRRGHHSTHSYQDTLISDE